VINFVCVNRFTFLKAYSLFFGLLLTFGLSAKSQIAEAYQLLEKSDLKSAITLFEKISASDMAKQDTQLYFSAQLGLAEAYTDLGAYHLSLDVLFNLTQHLHSTQSVDYLSFARVHRLIADNYDLLYYLEDFLFHVKEFNRYFELHSSDYQVFESLYFSYLGRYFNYKYDIVQANSYTLQSLEIYWQNPDIFPLDIVLKLYENHCFSIRNHNMELADKRAFVDTLTGLSLRVFPMSSVKRARLLISISSIELDEIFNRITENGGDWQTLNLHQNIQWLFNQYATAVSIYENAGLVAHDYLPRYYNLKSWINYAQKDYLGAYENINLGSSVYALNDFVHLGFAPNNKRINEILRFKTFVSMALNEGKKNNISQHDYLNLLILSEKFWERYRLEALKLDFDYLSDIYNQTPYKHWFSYYVNLYSETKDTKYLSKAHFYEEKMRYGALLESITITDALKAKRRRLAKLNAEINLLLDKYYEHRFFTNNDSIELNLEIMEAIRQFDSENARIKAVESSNIVSIETIQQKLKEHQAVVSYSLIDVFGKSKLYIKLITIESAEYLLLDNGFFQTDIDFQKLVDSVYTVLAIDDISAFVEVSSSLYDILFSPLEPYLPEHIRQIQIMPFPGIEDLAFDLLLYNSTNSRDYRSLPYLARRYDFSYLLSSSIVNFQNLNAAKNAKTSLSLFNPHFDSKVENELHYASLFSKRISKKFAHRSYLGNDASTENFKWAMQNSSVVAVLSHGKSSNNLSDEDKGIHLSNGFFSMDSVHQLKSITNFLILAACETGRGFTDGGEGNISLVRSFRLVGVNSILSAFWEIDEKASVDIIYQFLVNLEAGMDKSVALNAAKMQYLSGCIPRYGNPLYWAGMNIVGNNEPVFLTSPFLKR
jgi:CHAT domain-containing protein